MTTLAPRRETRPRGVALALFPDITCDDIFRLETAHLWLRWLRATDAPAVTGIASLTEVAEMTASIPHPYPPGEAERFILNARAATAAGAAIILAITQKSKSQALIGVVSAQGADEGREVEIGYMIAPVWAGHGYAAEAAATLIDAVFNLTEIRVVTANSRVTNPASQRVLEKCGFVRTGSGLKMLSARGGQHPCDFFALDRRTWSARGRLPGLPAMAQQRARDWPQVLGERAE